jgi:hypothetical protein
MRLLLTFRFRRGAWELEDSRMRKALMAALVLSLAVSLGCGGAAVGTLKSITLSATPSTNLQGTGGTVQLHALGVYSTGDTRDLTNKVTFAVTPTGTDDTGAALPAPPNTMTLNVTGLATAVAPFVCTWVDTSGGASQPSWAITGSYQVVASFKGITSQPVFVSVASAASSTSASGQCGP